MGLRNSSWKLLILKDSPFHFLSKFISFHWAAFDVVHQADDDEFNDDPKSHDEDEKKKKMHRKLNFHFFLHYLFVTQGFLFPFVHLFLKDTEFSLVHSRNAVIVHPFLVCLLILIHFSSLWAIGFRKQGRALLPTFLGYNTMACMPLLVISQRAQESWVLLRKWHWHKTFHSLAHVVHNIVGKTHIKVLGVKWIFQFLSDRKWSDLSNNFGWKLQKKETLGRPPPTFPHQILLLQKIEKDQAQLK